MTRLTLISLLPLFAAMADWVDRRTVERFCIGFVRGGTDAVDCALHRVQIGNLPACAFLLALNVAVVF